MDLNFIKMMKLILLISLSICLTSSRAKSIEEICQEVTKSERSYESREFINGMWPNENTKYRIKLQGRELFLIMEFIQDKNEEYIDCTMNKRDLANYATLSTKFIESSIIIPGKLLDDLRYTCKEKVITCYKPYKQYFTPDVKYLKLSETSGGIESTIFYLNGTSSPETVTKPGVNTIEGLRFDKSAYTRFNGSLPVFFALKFRRRCRSSGIQLAKFIEDANDMVVVKEERAICRNLLESPETEFDLRKLLDSEVWFHENYKIVNQNGNIKIVLTLHTFEKFKPSITDEEMMDVVTLKRVMGRPLTINLMISAADARALGKLCLKPYGRQCKINMKNIIETDDDRIAGIIISHTESAKFIEVNYYSNSALLNTSQILIKDMNLFYSIQLESIPVNQIYMTIDLTYCPYMKIPHIPKIQEHTHQALREVYGPNITLQLLKRELGDDYKCSLNEDKILTPEEEDYIKKIYDRYYASSSMADSESEPKIDYRYLSERIEDYRFVTIIE